MEPAPAGTRIALPLGVEAKWSAHHEDGELAEPATTDAPPGSARRPTLRSRLAQGTVPVEEHQLLVSAALVAEHQAAERALDLRVLPPARFRRPVPLDRNRGVVFRRPPPRARRARAALALFSAALALTSIAIASWNAYWLAAPLREAIGTFIG